MVKKLSMFFAAMLIIVAVGFGQSVQTGAISGTVTDQEGTALPGITVILKSPALVVPQMTTVSNNAGVYRYPALPPGIYEVTFMLEGMNTIVRKDVVVNLGKSVEVDVSMALKTQEETVIVSGKAPTVDRQTTTKTANLDIQFLEYIPALRTLGSYLNITPGANNDSVHGGSVRDTSYNLDGLNLSDPVVGGQGVFFGLDIMEEISVESGGLAAEYGQARGAVLNIVSKSGGNKLSGTASVYYRAQKLQSDNTKGTPLEGAKTGYKYEVEPGISIGGPLAKDKLWFFLSLSFNKREQNISGYPYDAGLGNEVPSDDFRPYPYLKLTYQPNQANKFSLSYNFSDIRRHHRGASIYQTELGTYVQTTPNHVVNLHWTRSFGANFFMNFKVGGYYSIFKMLRKGTAPSEYEYYTGRYSGPAAFDDINPRHRFQFNTDGTWFVDNLGGSHEIKFGAEFLYAWSGREMIYSDIPDAYGFQVYRRYAYGGSPYYVQYNINFKSKYEMMNIGLFAQDNWSISKNLTLNLGFRFESQHGYIPPQGRTEPLVLPGIVSYNRNVDKTISALNWNTISPRVSLIYDIFSNGSTLFKASFSRYYLANISQYFDFINPNSQSGYQGWANDDWSVDLENIFAVWGAPTLLGWKTHKLEAPYMDELTVGIERELFTDWSVGFRYIKKWDRKLIEDASFHELDMDALMDEGKLIWTNWEEVPYTETGAYAGNVVPFWNMLDFFPSDTALVNPPGANRDYDGLEFTLNKRYANGWQLNLSYVWQKSRGLIGTDFNDSWGYTGYFDSPNAHVNAIGEFPLERRHQVKLTGMVKGPWGVNFGTYFRYLSGERYTRTVRSTYYGIPLNQGATVVFAEERGSRMLPAEVILDLKVEKAFRLGPVNIRAFVDIFNLFNNNKATDVEDMSNHPTLIFENMVAIQNPRIFRLGAKIEF
ncbi:MAG: TonB-dependent receptor [Candidatus Aminicenantes bacterium]|nr:TonB-dependent receptor [Candidatus Aminicenantes bacterium]